MKLILFDIDGTLLLTGGAGIRAFNRAFSEMYDVENAWEEYDPHGKTDQQIIIELAREALGYEPSYLERIEIGNRYAKYFSEYIYEMQNFRLMPGIPDLLDALREETYTLGIATGNFKVTADHKLKRGKLDHFFKFGAYGSDAFDRLGMTRCALHRGLKLTNGKIDVSDVILIGDARQDVECGKALGLRVLAVATGSVSREKLQELNPGLALDNLSDLNRVLEFIHAS